MPPWGHPISDLNLSQLRVRGLRREGTGQPATSLQVKANKYRSTGRPTVMAAAPKLEQEQVSDSVFKLVFDISSRKGGLRSGELVLNGFSARNHVSIK